MRVPRLAAYRQRFFADKDYFSSKPVYQMLVFAEENEMPLWSDIVEREGLKTVRWHEEAVDLLPAGMSKQTASEAWLKHWVWKWQT